MQPHDADHPGAAAAGDRARCRAPPPPRAASSSRNATSRWPPRRRSSSPRGVNWGFFCSTPGVAVGRNLQRKHAMEMLLTGEPIERAAGAASGAWSTGWCLPTNSTPRCRSLPQTDRGEAARHRRRGQARLLPADGPRPGAGLRARLGGDLVELRARGRPGRAWTPSSRSARRTGRSAGGEAPGRPCRSTCRCSCRGRC